MNVTDADLQVTCGQILVKAHSCVTGTGLSRQPRPSALSSCRDITAKTQIKRCQSHVRLLKLCHARWLTQSSVHARFSIMPRCLTEQSKFMVTFVILLFLRSHICIYGSPVATKRSVCKLIGLWKFHRFFFSFNFWPQSFFGQTEANFISPGVVRTISQIKHRISQVNAPISALTHTKMLLYNYNLLCLQYETLEGGWIFAGTLEAAISLRLFSSRKLAGRKQSADTFSVVVLSRSAIPSSSICSAGWCVLEISLQYILPAETLRSLGNLVHVNLYWTRG